MSLLKIVTKVITSCCLTSFLMEIMMTKAPFSANFITFLQFFFVTFQGMFTLKSQIMKTKIPVTQYFLLVFLFFVTSVGNNYVYVLHVPSALHMIIRSASSPASMLVFWCVKRKRPKTNSIVGSVVITLGVIMATYGGAKVVEEKQNIFLEWCLGVTILSVMLIVGAMMGLQQEMIYSKFGKHPQEMLFFTHCLALPLFVGVAPDLKNIALKLTWDLWLVIAANIICHFFCTQSVHEMASKETSMTVTFILTVRKFISLIITSTVFRNNLTYLHVIGSVFVIIGTCFYFDFFSARQQRPVSTKDMNKVD